MMTRRIPGARVRGMTLVELMVGATIGLFLIIVMGGVYVGSKGTFTAQESTSRLQENGRFAMDTIANDLRMSGFRGCATLTLDPVSGKFTKPPVNVTLNTPTSVLYRYGEQTWGSHHSGGGWVPALTAPLSTLAMDGNSDLLVIRRPIGGGWSLTAEMASKNAALTITANPNFQQGDLLMVADCGGATVLQATNAAPGASGSIEHTPGALGLVPGVSTSDLGRQFLNDAAIWRVQTVAYYVGPSVRRSGEMALWSYTSPVYDGGAQQTELVTGVERMAVSYGVDTNNDSSADQFHTADAVADWSQVASTRVELLLVGEKGSSGSATQPIVFDGNTLNFTDRRMRTVMSLAVSLRNAVP